MREIGIRALKQNASGVVADAAAGEEIVITDRGRPVARLTALPSSRLAFLVDAGLARSARRDIADLPPPDELSESERGESSGESLSAALNDAREGERY